MESGAAEKVQRVREVVYLRETNAETYLLSNGSYECIVYAEDKYCKNDSGMLVPIDNTIVLDEGAVRNGQQLYRNTSNTFQVTFSNTVQPTVTMTKENRKITFEAMKVTSGDENRIPTERVTVTLGGVQNCSTLDMLTDTGSNTITYSNAFYNTDMVYVLQNNSLKEYIILKDADAPNKVSFLFSTEGLTFRETDGTGVFLDDSGTEVFRLSQLFAIDAGGDETTALQYTFSPVKGTQSVLITVELDESYLTAAGRAFPVVIDPSIEISSTKNPDASVYSAKPDKNYKYDNRLRTGRESSYGKCRSYISFTLPNSIDASQVTEATLALKKYSGVAPTVRAYKCTGSWTSGSITWNNKPDYTVVDISSESERRSSGSAWYEMDVTAMVQSWLLTPSSNYGFVVRENSESDSSHWTSFYSCDGSSSSIPELIITYTGSAPPEPPPPPTTTEAIVEPDLDAPSVKVILGYDQAYLNRYPTAKDRIEQHWEQVKAFYLREFDLYIDVVGLGLYTSYADRTMGLEDTEECENSSHNEIVEGVYQLIPKANHFTNAYNILVRLDTPSDDGTVRMVYIGHDVCRVYVKNFEEGPRYVHEYNSNTSNPLYGLGNPILRVMTIHDRRASGQELVTAIHEIGHMFFVDDHDEASYEGIGNYSNYCIYGTESGTYQTVNSIEICDYCRQIISDNIFHYSEQAEED